MTGLIMPCPSCHAELEAMSSKRGIVWLCRSCHAGAATLPILRQVAPRGFVNQLWQAARLEGQASSRICPSCTQPFTTLRGSPAGITPHLEVCTRCHWVWLSRSSLASLTRLRDPDRLASGPVAERSRE